MAIFIVSDCHLGHFNIIRYCNRPFATVAEMNDTIINNFNSILTPEDTLYHLGDFCMGGNYEYIVSLMNRINGKKVCILGNHDRKKFFYQMVQDKVIESCHDTLGITVEGQYIWLSHYPHLVWDQSHKGSWSAYGHVHGKLDGKETSLSVDCGVDSWNYFPVSFEQLSKKMNEIKVRNAL